LNWLSFIDNPLSRFPKKDIRKILDYLKTIDSEDVFINEIEFYQHFNMIDGIQAIFATLKELDVIRRYPGTISDYIINDYDKYYELIRMF